MHRRLLLAGPIAAFAAFFTAALGLAFAAPALADQSPPPSTPAPTPSPTPTATPLPANAQLDVLPPAGPPGTKLTITGAAFNPGEAITIEWDTAQHVVAQVTADAKGSLQVPYTAPDDNPGQHNICAVQVPGVCTQFTLQAPTPTPSPSSSPTAVPTSPPAASPSPAATVAPSPTAQPQPGASAAAMLLQPPFVAFPILAVLAAAAALVLWIRSRAAGRSRPVTASVVHRSRSPRGGAAGGWKAPGATAGQGSPPPLAPPVPGTEGPPAGGVEPRAEPQGEVRPGEAPPGEAPAPARGDEPPDLPEPGE